MKKENIEKILALVADSNKNLTEHVFQNEVNSSYLRKIKYNIDEIEKICNDDMSNNLYSGSVRSRLPTDNKDDILKISYAMSKFDYHLINRVTGNRFNQTGAFEFLEQVTGVKANTLKNMRDRFDPYVEQQHSKRLGWHQVELLPDYAKIKMYFDGKSEKFVADEISKIIERLKGI